MRRITPLAAALAATLTLGAGMLPERPDLLTCRVIVTGTDMRSRPEGLAKCVREVVVKVTGRPDLAEDPRVNAIVADAAGLVEDFAYLDRMSDIPMHDEQGSRDRPYDLIAHVNSVKLQNRLAEAGLPPLLSRPTVLALVTVVLQDGDRFALEGDGVLGERQRQAAIAAGGLYGLRVALPSAAQVQANGLDQLTPNLVHIGGSAVILRGSLKWSDADFGWVAAWRMDVAGTQESWEVRGVSFDEAFRAGVGGAARLLATRG